MRALAVSLILSCLCALSSSAQFNRTTYAYKLSPLLSNTIGRNESQLQTFWIISADTIALKKYFSERSSRITVLNTYPSIGMLVVRSRWDLIDSLLPSTLIKFVDIPRIPKEELAVVSTDNSVNQINLAHHNFPTINGNNIVVSIKENRFDSSDIDFKGRFLSTPLGSPQLTMHALIMASLIGGGGNSFYTGKGAAWGSRLSSSNFATLLPETDASYQQYQISVQNHSYGTGIENFYGTDAAAYDASVIANQSLLHVFSAGNSGNLASNAGAYNGIAGLANITGSFKMAKNILAVGATDSFSNVAQLSSKGPAYDGRVKPELVAFGEDGSSGAAALVSGTALLIQQAYKELNGQLPSSALVRAILINTANDPGNEGPDYTNGFGVLNANAALKKTYSGDYWQGSIQSGNTIDHSLHVSSGLNKIKITLCWNDPPNTPNSPIAIINDLDLELVNTTTGEIWQPWILSRFANKDSLLLPAKRGKDQRNTIELISLLAPAAGDYIIRVKASTITNGPQNYFVVYDLEEKNKFEWTFPSSTDNLFSNSSGVLRWNSNYSGVNGSLEYQTINNSQWKSINSNIDLSQHYFRWSVPDSFTVARLKMTVNGQQYLSDSFSISNSLNPKVGFNCTDSFLLYWNKSKGVDSFIVYKLGDRYLEEFKRTKDSFIVIGKSNNSTLHYTVAPILSKNINGLRNESLNYTKQGVECYIKSFLVYRNMAVANLFLTIGTTYRIKSIDAEKFKNNSFQQLQSVNYLQPGRLDYVVNDVALQKGGHTYRFKITLDDGKIIYSNPEIVYYLADSKYLVFPNPVNRSQRLSIHSSSDDPSTIILFNSQGQKVLEKQLRDPVEEITINKLQKGVYFYIIYKNNKKDSQGNILIQ